MLTKLAVILAGVWLILHAANQTSTLLTYIFGGLIVALPLIEELRR